MDAIDQIIAEVSRVVGPVSAGIYGRHIRASLTNNRWLCTDSGCIRVTTPPKRVGLRINALVTLTYPDTNQQVIKRYLFTYGKKIKGTFNDPC